MNQEWTCIKFLTSFEAFFDFVFSIFQEMDVPLVAHKRVTKIACWLWLSLWSQHWNCNPCLQLHHILLPWVICCHEGIARWRDSIFTGCSCWLCIDKLNSGPFHGSSLTSQSQWRDLASLKCEPKTGGLNTCMTPW